MYISGILHIYIYLIYTYIYIDAHVYIVYVRVCFYVYINNPVLVTGVHHIDVKHLIEFNEQDTGLLLNLRASCWYSGGAFPMPCKFGAEQLQP